jgi:hypothetical protein
MRPDLPLTAIIGPILSHTPTYVWVILAALVVAGSLQLRPQRISRTRLLVMPSTMVALSLWSVSSAFGARAPVLVVWAVGVCLVLLVNRALRSPRSVGSDDGSGAFLVGGSPWPLVLMLTVFALRYAVAVTLVLHPQWRTEPAFTAEMALLYGALSGLFTARAVRILTSRSADRVAIARDGVATA